MSRDESVATRYQEINIYMNPLYQQLNHVLEDEGCWSVWISFFKVCYEIVTNLRIELDKVQCQIKRATARDWLFELHLRAGFVPKTVVGMSNLVHEWDSYLSLLAIQMKTLMREILTTFYFLSLLVEDWQILRRKSSLLLEPIWLKLI